MSIGFPYGGMLLAMLLMLAFWVLVIVGVVWLVVVLVRGSRSGSTTPTFASQSPLDILKMRYARGEITKDQFDQMRRDLGE